LIIYFESTDGLLTDHFIGQLIEDIYTMSPGFLM